MAKEKIKKRRGIFGDAAEDTGNQGSPMNEEAAPGQNAPEEKPAANPEGEVAAPQLHGKKRVGKGEKKFEQPGSNNMSREVQPEMDEGKPELDSGEPELEE